MKWHNDGADTASDLKTYSSDDTIDLTIDAATLNAGVLDFYVEFTSPDGLSGVNVSSSNEAYSETV